MLKKIDHIGIAVNSIALTATILEKLGLVNEGWEDVTSQRLRVAFFSIGGVQIELLEPTSPDSTVAKFLETKGQGLHHIAYETEGIDQELERLAGEGFQLIDKEARPSAHNTRIAFLHPKSTGKILTELVEHRHE
jgi:methylmalonyl-CoA/ethylmalonyl-CoA epimerase